MLLVEWYWLTIERVCVCVCVCLLIGLFHCYSIQSLYQHVDAQGMYYMGPRYPMDRGTFGVRKTYLGMPMVDTLIILNNIRKGSAEVCFLLTLPHQFCCDVVALVVISHNCRQCFDTVGCASGRAKSIRPVKIE